MHIRSLSIRNFRCIDSLDIDFAESRDGAGCMVLAGDNGVGKTSVLDAIRFALWSDKHPPRSRADVGPSGDGFEITVRGGKHESSVAYRAGNIVCKGPRAWVTCGHVGSAIMGASESLLVTDAFRRDRVAKFMEFFAGTLGVGDDPAFPRFTLTKPGKKYSVSIGEWGAGEQSLFSFAVSLCCAPKPIHVGLMDNPECGLHPTWQRGLLPALRRLSPSTQFIVATHSEHVLDSVLSSERSLICADDDPRAIDRKPYDPGLTAEQSARMEEFRVEHRKRHGVRPGMDSEPFTYGLKSTGVGTTQVLHCECGEKCDVTDYGSR